MTGVERWRSVAAASAVVERRQASAPDSGGRRKPSLRGARPCPLARQHETLRLPAFRFLYFSSLRAQAKQSSSSAKAGLLPPTRSALRWTQTHRSSRSERRWVVASLLAMTRCLTLRLARLGRGCVARTRVHYPPDEPVRACVMPREGGASSTLGRMVITGSSAFADDDKAGRPSEGWWRGRLRWSFISVAEKSSEPAPLPPSFARFASYGTADALRRRTLT